MTFFFNWRLVAYDICVGFCHTSVGISHRYTCVPALLNPAPVSLLSPPLSMVTSSWVERPMAVAVILYLVVSDCE